MAERRVAILQTNYIPWRGYFDLIGIVDEFITYDVVQFTKNDWRNRNRIKTAKGLQWLTIPVMTAGRFGQTIADTVIADGNWSVRHWRSVSQAYARAPYFERYEDRFAALYGACQEQQHLSVVNEMFIDAIASELGLPTRLTRAADYPAGGDKNARLVAMCQAAMADVYLSGPSGRDYLNIGLFDAAGIRVEFMDYSGYQPYPQIHGPFEPAVSALDLLFNAGPSALEYLSCGQRLRR